MVNTPRRQRLSLDGTWQFHVDGEAESRGDIPVPLPWEVTYPDLRDRPVTATYTRTVTVPAGWKGSIIRLIVGAADYYSEVSVNGYLAGNHEGGYLPFALEVQEFLRYGAENTISIKVTDNAPARTISGAGDLTPERKALEGIRPFPFTEIPHGKQSWYGTVGGIWQSVHLERCPDVFVENVFVRPDVPRQGASVRVRLEHPPLDPTGYSLRLSVKEPKGAGVVLPVELPLPGARQATINMALSLPDAALWDTEHPNLYGLTIELRYNGKIIDTCETRFGMRSIEAKEGNILLNGVPVFIAGALDQDFYPGTIYTPPSTAFLRDQFKKAKELGLNLLRCHIKTPDPRYLELCDEMGLMVWYEIPSWAVLTKNSGKRGREHFEQMLERDYNHASLLILTVMNESWGIDLTQKWQRDWLVDMFEYAKALDPSRLIVDNSACEGNYHVKSDLDDYHIYFSVPDHADRWKEWMQQFANRPAFTYTRFGDAQRTGKEPILLSEFGNWGLPKVSALRKAYGGEEPWWFFTGAGAARPEGCEARFKRYNLDKIYGNYDRLAEVSQDQEFLSLKFEIEEMRKYSSIVGYVITEFTDLHWESNGLLDMCRNPKTFHRKLAPLQAQDLVFIDHDYVAFWAGDSVALPVLLSHFGSTDLSGGTVRWEVEGAKGLSGEIPLSSAAPAIGTSPAGTIAFTVPEVSRSSSVTLHLRLIDKTGRTVNTNTAPLYFFPAAARRIDLGGAPVYIHNPDRSLPSAKAALTAAGIRVVNRPTPGALMLTSVMDDTAQQFVAEGGTALLLALDRTSLPRTYGGPLSVTRDQNGWWGDWCSGLTWFKPEGAKNGGPFASLPQTRQFDLAFRHIAPRRVLVGWDHATEFDDIWSGLVLGWIHHPATLVGGFTHGHGKVLATTFELFKRADIDPVSVVLLGDLLRFAASPRFAPKKRVEMRPIDLPLTLIPTAEAARPATWRYTTETPSPDWTTPDFNDSPWKTGRAGFGRGFGQAQGRTRWTGEEIYLRIAVDIPPTGVGRVAARLHGENLAVWVNGEPLLTRSPAPKPTSSNPLAEPPPGRDYEDVQLSPDQAALFHPGHNVVSVRCHASEGPPFVDIGFTYEPATATAHIGNGTGETPTEAHPPTESSQSMAQDREGVLQTTG